MAQYISVSVTLNQRPGAGIGAAIKMISPDDAMAGRKYIFVSGAARDADFLTGVCLGQIEPQPGVGA